ncbi:hypothetical protein VBQ65_23725, partial [Klebsiella pneumoniae]|nr:hypothetical protein [Klebsiella pneumoniae]
MAEVPLPTPTDNAVPSTDIRDSVYAGAMLDKVVTSTDLTYTDRLGGEHYTVDGIKAEGDKVVEETRQNLIPLSRQYMTLDAAQADIANIPVGSTIYVRSQDGSSLADEYMNVAGTLTATGRRMPSQAAVEAVSESLMLQIDDIGDRQIEIQRKIDGFSSSVFDSSANDLLIALTDALGRRTWLEADLRGRPSPYSVRLLREVLPDLLTGILFDSERYGLSAAITDSAGRRTWLEADMEGKPSARSAELIGGVIADYLPQSLIDALVDLLAPLISGEPRPIATALSTARQDAKREYPTLTKPLTAPVFSKSDQAAISIYWPWLFDATVIGVNKIYLYYSTDHAANHADSGIYLASA